MAHWRPCRLLPWPWTSSGPPRRPHSTCSTCFPPPLFRIEIDPHLAPEADSAPPPFPAPRRRLRQPRDELTALEASPGRPLASPPTPACWEVRTRANRVSPSDAVRRSPSTSSPNPGRPDLLRSPRAQPRLPGDLEHLGDNFSPLLPLCIVASVRMPPAVRRGLALSCTRTSPAPPLHPPARARIPPTRAHVLHASIVA